MTVGALTLFEEGLSNVSADNLNTCLQGCQSFSALRALSGVTGMQVWCGGGLTVSDGLQGFFYWNASATGADDGIDIIKPVGAGSAGRWLRIPFIPIYEVAWELMGGTPPQANEIVGMHVFSTNVFFQPNFGFGLVPNLAFGQTLTNPHAAYSQTAFKVPIAGGGPADIGSLTISTAGAFGFSTVSQAGVSFAPGDLLYWEAQTTPDISLANFAWTIVGAPTT
jgi:hypothetical protein